MDSIKQGSGDNSNPQQSIGGTITCESSNDNDLSDKMDSTAQMIDDSEVKLKERITQCKNIIDSLKLELKEEKFKLEKESKTINIPLENVMKCSSSIQKVCSTHMLKPDLAFSTDMYSACIESKLNCDENLMEYEKQLQKYQNTLNMAQTEKKKGIRKQMLAKAYKLKLLEIENQCNVELLRVKQCLQCLEPLKIIASKWKSNPGNIFDGNSFDLIPRYSELDANSGTEINSLKKIDMKTSDEDNDDCGKNGT